MLFINALSFKFLGDVDSLSAILGNEDDDNAFQIDGPSDKLKNG